MGNKPGLSEVEWVAHPTDSYQNVPPGSKWKALEDAYQIMVF
jgi:hypothetical protein